MDNRVSYLFVELAILVTVLAFTFNMIQWRTYFSRATLCKAGALFLLWLMLDQLALSLGLWSFPVGHTLSYRLLRLPLEEYLIFVLHTLLCLMMLDAFIAMERK